LQKAQQILKREKELLPRKKQRALEKMTHLLDHDILQAKDAQRWDDVSVHEAVRKLLEPPTSEQ